jgi:hypothetical protein
MVGVIKLELLCFIYFEGFFMIGAGLGMIGIRLRLRRILLIGMTYGSIVYIIRQLYIFYHIPFGSHTLIFGICLAVLMKVMGRQGIFDGIIASLISFILLLWGEGTFLYPFLKYFQFNQDTLLARPGGLFLAGILSDLFLIMTFFITYVFKVTILDLNYFRRKSKI